MFGESYLGPRARTIMPVGQTHQYQTYSIQATPDTQVVEACKDVGCPAWAHGWETTVDERTSLGQAQAAYIRTRSGRTQTERKTVEGLTVFRFEAFQRCFAEHRTKRDRLTRRHGDFRGNPSGSVYVHRNALDWAEDAAEHQAKINDLIQKG